LTNTIGPEPSAKKALTDNPTQVTRGTVWWQAERRFRVLGRCSGEWAVGDGVLGESDAVFTDAHSGSRDEA